MKMIKIDKGMQELYSKIKWHLFSGHDVYYTCDDCSSKKEKTDKTHGSKLYNWNRQYEK